MRYQLFTNAMVKGSSAKRDTATWVGSFDTEDLPSYLMGAAQYLLRDPSNELGAKVIVRQSDIDMELNTFHTDTPWPSQVAALVVFDRDSNLVIAAIPDVDAGITMGAITGMECLSP